MITDQWNFVDAFSIEHARFEDHEVPVEKWFDLKTGPNKYKLDFKGKILEELGQTAKQMIDKANDDAKDTQVTGVIAMGSRIKRQREEALQKARSRSTPHKQIRRLTWTVEDDK